MTTAVEGYNVAGGPATPVYMVNASAPAPAASENYLGAVGGKSVQIDCIPTLSVHANYVTGDYVGESNALFEVPDAARIDGGSGMVFEAALIDYAKQSVPMELWLFDRPVSPPADSAPWALSDADLRHCFGVIPFSTYYATANNSISFSSGSGNYPSFVCAPDNNNIYFCLVARGSPAFASGDLTVRLHIWQN